MKPPEFQSTLPASAIANQLIEWSQRDNIPIDTLGMHKLVYLCHGWHLGLTMRPLIREAIVAWGFGPLIESLYHVLQKEPSRHLTKKILVVGWANGNTKGIPKNHPAYNLIHTVWTSYKKYSSAQLSTMTHSAGTPWHTTMLELGLIGKTEVEGPCPVISDATIAAHYAKKAQEAPSQS